MIPPLCSVLTLAGRPIFYSKIYLLCLTAIEILGHRVCVGIGVVQSAKIGYVVCKDSGFGEEGKRYLKRKLLSIFLDS